MILIGNDIADYWTRAYGLSPPSRLVDLIADAAASQVTRARLDLVRIGPQLTCRDKYVQGILLDTEGQENYASSVTIQGL